jgi:ankyrin repeat protein
LKIYIYKNKTRGSAESRDSRGCTLLMIAAENDHVNLVEFLLTHWKKIDEGNVFLGPNEMSMEAKTFKVSRYRFIFIVDDDILK